MAGKKKTLKITFNSPVVLTFVALCFAVTLIGIMTSGTVTRQFFMTYHSSLKSPLTYVRLFTHVLGHGGWTHFIGNASYLLLLGPMLEEKYGSRILVEIILITAVITGIVNYIFFPHVALYGASGVVFAFILLASFTGFKNGEIPVTFLLVAVIYIGQQVYEGLTVTDDVSNMAHIIGGFVGAFVGYHLNKRVR
jgi:GlpG protein